MAFTYKELKQAKENIMKAFGLDGPQASKVVGYYNGVGGDPETVKALISGDLSAVPAALSALGFTKETPGAPTDDVTEINKAEKITPETPTDNIIDNDVADGFGGGLPVGLYDDICAIIDGFAESHDIQDKQKIHPLQFAAACTLVGVSIKKRGLLMDVEFNRTHGGNKYNPEKVLALLYLYEYVCGNYRQVAFSHNFPKFAGVSREWFNDYMQRDLTSSRVGLAQKAHEIQKASLVGAITSGGSATVGNIFLGKALAGLQETVTIQHVSTTATPTAVALPVFDSDSPKLTDTGGE